jgi:hypothetical protein
MQLESPLRYFESPPTVRITAGGRLMSELAPSDNTVIDVTVPPDVLRAGDGLVVLETNQTFVPAERGGALDQRRLGLRIFGVSVSVPN